MRKLTFMAFLFLYLQSHSLLGAENDQYPAWGKDIKDSTEIVNHYVNREISKVLRKVNRGLLPRTCSSVAYRIGLHFSWGGTKKTDKWAEKNPRIDKYPREDSRSQEDEGIYADIQKVRFSGRTINLNQVH